MVISMDVEVIDHRRRHVGEVIHEPGWWKRTQLGRGQWQYGAGKGNIIYFTAYFSNEENQSNGVRSKSGLYSYH